MPTIFAGNRPLRGRRPLMLAAVASSLAFGCGPGGHRVAPGLKADVLLYDGAGASPNDVKAIETVLHDAHLSLVRANSDELEALAPAALRSYRLILVPGGDFVAMSNALSRRASSKLRGAVAAGLPYLGICAGGFLAGPVRDRGLDLTSGVRFGFYAAERNGIRKAAVSITSPGLPRSTNIGKMVLNSLGGASCLPDIRTGARRPLRGGSEADG